MAAIQRSRLWARVAASSQAALALNLPRGKVPQPDAGLEVADREFDDRVAAVIGVQLDGGADPVGDKGVVAPGR
jgi:hypothetical protein